jgi:predicted regulator of Ras-like GTPase activity (Roadblock/LC7/MglB family)
MATLPVLINEDIEQIDAVLEEFVVKSEAEIAVITAEGGFVIASAGKTSEFDITTIGALAANAGCATEAVAKLIGEPNFSMLYQQGQKRSLLVSSADRYHSLIVVFPSNVSAGAVKYLAADTAERIAKQLAKARERAPHEGIDPISLNISDHTQIFRRGQV